MSRARPNNSFKPNLLRYTKAMAEEACHGFGSTTQVGLTQALGVRDENMTRRALLISGSVLCGLGALYCFLWIFSAASLASGFCVNGFSLFAEHLRCRQVHFAMILTVFFLLLCVFLCWRAARASHRPAA